MKRHIQSFIELWDIPGGAILGLFSLAMLGMCVAAFILTAKGRPTDIPANVKEIYNWLLSAFAASKAVKSFFGKVLNEQTKDA